MTNDVSRDDVYEVGPDDQSGPFLMNYLDTINHSEALLSKNKKQASSKP